MISGLGRIFQQETKITNHREMDKFDYLKINWHSEESKNNPVNQEITGTHLKHKILLFWIYGHGPLKDVNTF